MKKYIYLLYAKRSRRPWKLLLQPKENAVNDHNICMWRSAIDTPTNRLLLRWIWSSAGGGGRTCEDAWGIDEGRAITNDEGCGPIVLAALEALASPADLTYQTNNQRWTRRD